jgi:phosphatidylserine/phosphatidylglycerophosphate/cardiolipin synthase-like enzyme
MVRFHTPPMAAQAREVFDNTLAHCREIELETWKERHSLWERLKQHWSYFLLVRLDPYIARYQWRWLPD